MSLGNCSSRRCKLLSLFYAILTSILISALLHLTRPHPLLTYMEIRFSALAKSRGLKLASLILLNNLAVIILMLFGGPAFYLLDARIERAFPRAYRLLDDLSNPLYLIPPLKKRAGSSRGSERSKIFYMLAFPWIVFVLNLALLSFVLMELRSSRSIVIVLLEFLYLFLALSIALNASSRSIHLSGKNLILGYLRSLREEISRISILVLLLILSAMIESLWI